MSPPFTPSVGERYRLEHLLGQGGMGSVYRAYDRLTGQRVALKLVPAGPNASRPVVHDPSPLPLTQALENRYPPTRSAVAETMAAPLQERHDTGLALADTGEKTQSSPKLLWTELALAQEFRTLAALRHPHIISVLDYGFIARSQPFFTMELLENAQPLSDASKGLPLQRQALLLVQLLQALSYLHRHGILHRDLKHANVMVRDSKDGLQVKLLDFGLARARVQAAAEEGDIAGTLPYMAPELFVGTPPSAATDLFAVGVLAYEVFTGRHPFDRGNDFELVASIIGNEPDWQPLAQHSALVAILHRLLAKSPAARPSADEALTALCAAVGLPADRETAAVRESALQAARFVGREQSLWGLRAALDTARGGSGEVQLLAGESGVGKSRLLEELRIYSLVQGVLCVRGQAVSQGGGVYGVWREILRTLCLCTKLDELDASVLKSILPDLEVLLERTIPDAPVLNPLATQLRLAQVVASVIGRRAEPLLVLLEDLHWADADSLALLHRLASSCRAQPILILASYRDDERPDLPQEIPGCPVLKLTRLSTSSITELCQSMLGEKGCTPELLRFVEAETEGNVFFVIEVMRALAEEAGQLSLVAARRLPLSVLTGGIQAIVQRRLCRLPAEARPLLQLAAVAGRQLDLGILRCGEARIEPWLYMAADAAVLEASGQFWRFAHDKIRESLILELSPADLQRLHLVLAHAVETTYPGSAPHAAALAEHYQSGGSPTQAAFYLVEAGAHALSQGATEQATMLLMQALAPESRARLSTPQAARAHNCLIQAQTALGRLLPSIATYEQLLAQVGFPMPAKVLSMAAAGGTLLAQRLRLLPRVALVTDEQRRLFSDVAHATRWACEAYLWTSQPHKSILAGLHGAALADALADKGLQSYFLALFGYLAGLVPLRRASQRFFASAARSIQGLSNSRAALDVGRVASAYYVNSANWRLAISHLDALIALSRQIGDDNSLMFGLAQRFVVAFRQEEESVAESTRHELHRLARRNQSEQFLRTSPLYQGLKALRREDADSAWRLLAEAEGYLKNSQDLIGRILAGGLIALCLLQQGKPQAALLRARATLALAGSARLSNSVVGEGLSAVSEVYLRLWETGNPAARRQLNGPLRQALAALRRCARIFPAVAPRALLWHGRDAWNQGAGRLARRLGEASQRRAQRLGMPFDEALAQKWLGRFVEPSPAAAGLAGELRGLFRLLARGVR